MSKYLPKRNEVIGWKKLAGNRIAKVKIPKGVSRIMSCSRKCRAAYVEVIQIYDPDGNISKCKRCSGWWDNTTKYEVGKIVKCQPFFDRSKKVCSFGIHFFLTRKEAEEWGS